MAKKIFICYRSTDEPFGAALVDQTLSQEFGSDMIFRAARSIGGGEDFKEKIFDTIQDAAVLLVVIGANWFTDRLKDPKDFVRLEIIAAHENKVPIIPVLMNATRIKADQLPAELAWLAEHQDMRVHFRNSQVDLSALAERLRQLLPGAAPKPDPGENRTGTSVHAEKIGTVNTFNEKVEIGSFTITNN